MSTARLAALGWTAGGRPLFEKTVRRSPGNSSPGENRCRTRHGPARPDRQAPGAPALQLLVRPRHYGAGRASPRLLLDIARPLDRPGLAAGKLFRRGEPAGRRPGDPDRDRRLDDRCSGYRVLRHDGRRGLCVRPVRTPAADELPVGSRQPGNARHLHRDLRLFDHGAEDDQIARRAVPARSVPRRRASCPIWR